jgi:hypothetical protein
MIEESSIAPSAARPEKRRELRYPYTGLVIMHNDPSGAAPAEESWVCLIQDISRGGAALLADAEAAIPTGAFVSFRAGQNLEHELHGVVRRGRITVAGLELGIEFVPGTVWPLPQ